MDFDWLDGAIFIQTEWGVWDISSNFFSRLSLSAIQITAITAKDPTFIRQDHQQTEKDTQIRKIAIKREKR